MSEAILKLSNDFPWFTKFQGSALASYYRITRLLCVQQEKHYLHEKIEFCK